MADETKDIEEQIEIATWESKIDFWKESSRQYRESYVIWRAVAITLIFVLSFTLMILLVNRI